MLSTSASESGDKLLLSVEKLDLVFQVDVHRSWTWRDAFTRFAKDPAGVLLNEKDRVQVAREISFKVRVGERIGIMGVNGTGKTSLCRVIAGMYMPSRGKVVRHGNVRAIFDTSVGIQP